MPNPISITISSTGATPTTPINLDRYQSPFNVSLAVTGSSSGSFTYNIEYTLDDQQYLTNIGSTRSLVWFPDANLSTASSNGTTNYMFPVSAVRCTCSTLNGAVLVLTVLQGGPP